MRGTGLVSLVLLTACASVSSAQSPPIAPVSEDAPLSVACPDDVAPRFWFSADYLLWKIPSAALPPLVGTIPVESVDPIQVLPDSTIRTVFGSGAGRFDPGWQSGWRVEAGLWLDNASPFGVAVGYFQLAPNSQHEVFTSAAQAPLGVTFHDPAAGQQVLIMDAVPGLRNGAVSISTNNRLWGAEANALFRLPAPTFLAELNLLAGFRHLQFEEGLDIDTVSAAVPGGRLPCG